ncbi:VOC family protein [Actinomadura barringtoniae]|uniref:VOC family protein n=1 Tax=Actinomadura barringtoniae TaxID=1427535 RepID=A0A939PCN9_9ACTN|nr:VOC family protein [Actinomadura barringtoniae]MBO2447618.1 VOC family protein [Actinomadura barringtoniae]
MTQIAIHLVVSDPDHAASWYAEALGATETSRLALPGGSTLTVELRLGDTVLAVAGEMPERDMRTPATLGGTPAAFHVQVPDADAAMTRALEAGATTYEPIHDAFWGDRTGQFLDPFGHRWAVNQHLRDVPHEEIVARATELFTGSTTA